MTTILIIYHTQGGNTEKMATAVAEGVNSIENCSADFKDAFHADVQDLMHCDGLIIGSPEYFGYMSGIIKDFFDRTYDSARQKVFRKPYTVFINAGNDGSGALRSIERICLGYQFKKVYEAIVAKGEITRQVLDECKKMGQTLAAGCAAHIY